MFRCNSPSHSRGLGSAGKRQRSLVPGRLDNKDLPRHALVTSTYCGKQGTCTWQIFPLRKAHAFAHIWTNTILLVNGSTLLCCQCQINVWANILNRIPCCFVPCLPAASLFTQENHKCLAHHL